MGKVNVTFVFAAAQRLINAANHAEREITVNGKTYGAVELLGIGLAHQALADAAHDILALLTTSGVRAVMVGQPEATSVEDEESDFNLPATRLIFLVEATGEDVEELEHPGEHVTSPYCFPVDPLGLNLGCTNRPILHLTALPHRPYSGSDLPL